jgi:hypothetical protein
MLRLIARIANECAHASRPEDRARDNIDRLLTGAGWLIQNRSVNIEAAAVSELYRFRSRLTIRKSASPGRLQSQNVQPFWL